MGMIRCHLNAGGAGPEEPLPTRPVPPELDWDFWCGPAPLRPFNGGNPVRPDDAPGTRGIHPRGHRHYLDFANGSLGDIGVHWLDTALWITGENAPRRVHSTGGRPVKGPPVLSPDAQTSDAPDHQVVHYTFDRFTLTWESRLFGGNDAEKGDVAGMYLYGTKGTLQLGHRGGWVFYPSGGGAPQVTRWWMSWWEWEAVKVRRSRALPLATVGKRMAGARMPAARRAVEASRAADSGPRMMGTMGLAGSGRLEREEKSERFSWRRARADSPSGPGRREVMTLVAAAAMAGGGAVE